MEDNVQPEQHLDLSIRNRSDLDDDIEKDQQQQPPPLLKQRLSTVTVCSLLDVETDPETIGSLELLLNSVVKIFCTSIPCSFESPW